MDKTEAKQDAENESLTKLISSNIQPMREDQVQNAVKFLSHPKVQGSPVIHRRSFLEKKGLSREEIDEAFRRVPDPPPSASGVNASTEAVQQNSPASRQSQAPAMPMNPAPVGSIPETSPVQPYKFQWSHALLAISILTASGAGTAVIFKNTVLPRLRDWICKVVKEKDIDEKQEKFKEDVAEGVAEAAKQAAAAVAIIAKTSQELLLAKSEDKKFFEALKGSMDAQLEELKSVGNAIRTLEIKKESKSFYEQQMHESKTNAAGSGTANTSQKIAYSDRSELNFSPTDGRLNGSFHKNSLLGRPTSAPSSAVEPNETPYSKSYMDIMAMIQRGETPPGIKEIDDMPPNPPQPITNARLAPRPKPWEKKQIHSSVNGSSQEIMEPLWAGRNANITGIVSAQEGQKPIEFNELRGQGWLPPQPPSVSIPEAAIAIRQPKPSAAKQQVVNEISVAQYHLKDQEVVRPGSGEEAGSSGNEIAVPRNYVADLAVPSTGEIEEDSTEAIRV